MWGLIISSESEGSAHFSKAFNYKEPRSLSEHAQFNSTSHNLYISRCLNYTDSERRTLFMEESVLEEVYRLRGSGSTIDAVWKTSEDKSVMNMMDSEM